MGHSIAATLVIATLLRLIVPFLRSAMLKGVWTKAPKWLRPILLCGIAGLLGLADAISLGTSIPQAMLSALAAVGVAVSSYETGKGVKMPKKPDPLNK
jgi:hypothetical protein